MRHLREHEDGKDEIDRLDAGPAFGQRELERVRLVEHPQHHAHQQKYQEERED